MHTTNQGDFNDPGKNFLRLRDRLREVQDKRMTFNFPKKQSILCEFTPLNTKLLTSPKWRERSPEKWMSSRDFLHSTNGRITTSQAENSQGHKRAFSTKFDPYIDGLNAIGDKKIVRNVPKLRNNKSKLFNSVIARDPWQHRIKNSVSIRAAKALETVLQQNIGSSSGLGGTSMSPSRRIKKGLELKTYEYKVFTMNEAQIKLGSSDRRDKNRQKKPSKKAQTVESILKNIHSSGYYVSAIERLRRRKKTSPRLLGSSKFEDLNLPPDPDPLNARQFEDFDLQEIHAMKKQHVKSDISSGPERQISMGVESPQFEESEKKKLEGSGKIN